jgi:hypothetical protein
MDEPGDAMSDTRTVTDHAHSEAIGKAVDAARRDLLQQFEALAASFYDDNQSRRGRQFYEASERLRALIAKLRQP